MNVYSAGSRAPPTRYISVSLPSCRRASVSARSEPSASPSGFSCVVTRKRECARAPPRPTPYQSPVLSSVSGAALVDQLRHPHAALDRRIVLEHQVEACASASSRLTRACRTPCADWSASRLCSRFRSPPRTLVHARVSQVGRSLDAGDRDEADARVGFSSTIPSGTPEGLVPRGASAGTST